MKLKFCCTINFSDAFPQHKDGTCPFCLWNWKENPKIFFFALSVLFLL